MEGEPMKKLFSFLLALWKANLLATMEFRIAFITQALGMILNDAMYFVFWLIFFDRFQQVRGWELGDMFLLFGVVATGFGLAVFLFGNLNNISDVIIQGRLDYYLALPRPVLLHLLASRSIPSGVGDVFYGILCFFLAGQPTLDAFVRFLLGTAFSAMMLVCFMVVVHSLAFWMGNAQLFSSQIFNALVTFASYPATLFDNTAKFILFTLIPAGLLGTLPSGFVRSFSWERLALMVVAALLLLGLAVGVFYRGLRRYESGSAIQVQT
jgi:ABC-2 type transport system permease protein